jgi:hypothetical protein
MSIDMIVISFSKELWVYILNEHQQSKMQPLNSRTLKPMHAHFPNHDKHQPHLHHIALLFFANLFFCSPSSLELLSPKKLLFFFVGRGALAPGFAPDMTTALALALGLIYNPLLPILPPLLLALPLG